MDGQTITAADIYGDPADRMIDGLWDQYAAYIEYRQSLYRRHKQANHALVHAAMPLSDDDQPDGQLIHAMKAELTKPKYLYVNQRQWEDAPAKLVAAVAMMDLAVRTSQHIPEDRALLSIDEFNPDDIGRAMERDHRVPILH